ncbi:leucyl/phenylalanyl-tRNA--protein transferase [Hephaestia sp. GCM10023244]|uniref:leucyl/phenylalanyl-tRNA--protein transferase n=1 Tax=unclassified Hephaestia TaxID=2631281 RepID=UPI0020770E6F|nr:leucyl/phenylalanyl-tRNA--protein transferase [Hephaestia sp. MAHUQ-44]MCM8730725.1 leucyl/phenylalanyl-tRNA--protein transferase [Hephaestia sp. MAHUQ-44]
MTMLDPHLVLGAYASGVFPMADSRDADSIFWVEPRQRAILPLNRFRVSHSLRKTIAADRFRVTADAAFAQVLRLCAERAENRADTWINHAIERVFIELHRMGYAHSIECWRGDRLVGGLYGMALGRAFFGESMVSRETDASKVALAWLIARLKYGRFTLLDCQFQTDHLASLGAVEISRADYLELLGSALDELAGAGAGAAGVGVGAGASASTAASLADSSLASPDFFALDAPDPSDPIATVSGPVSGRAIVQLLVHTS